jgi:hypothetical protein
MEHVYIVGYWDPSDGKFQVSDVEPIRADAETAFSYHAHKQPTLNYCLIEGRVIRTSDPEAV